eukprot:1887589-Pleurochrysis_carterae.AAC.2
MQQNCSTGLQHPYVHFYILRVGHCHRYATEFPAKEITNTSAGNAEIRTYSPKINDAVIMNASHSILLLRASFYV